MSGFKSNQSTAADPFSNEKPRSEMRFEWDAEEDDHCRNLFEEGAFGKSTVEFEGIGSGLFASSEQNDMNSLSEHTNNDENN